MKNPEAFVSATHSMQVLIVAAKWWPLSARLSMALLSQGCRVTALCPKGHPLNFVTGIERCHEYSGMDSIGSLRRALLASRPDVIVPCDDGVVMQLHALARQEPGLRELLERSLGPLDSHRVTASRHELLALADELGIAIPPMRVVSSAEDLVHWHEQVAPDGVLKSDGESAGEGVRVFHSLAESLDAWQRLRRPLGRLTAWKRWLIDADPLALWMAGRPQDKQVILQGFITGCPANSMVACRDGEVLALVSVSVAVSDGPTGASRIVRRIDNEPMTRAATLIAGRLRLNGFYGFDYVLETSTGTPFLIEMNPRCTQLGHLDFHDRGSLAEVWAAAMHGRPRIKVRDPIVNDAVAFFPQALATGPTCKGLVERSFLDVPGGQPALLSELERPPAPRRGWLSRVYHAFRPDPRSEPLVFDTLEPAIDARAGNPGKFGGKPGGKRRTPRAPRTARVPQPQPTRP